MYEMSTYCASINFPEIIDKVTVLTDEQKKYLGNKDNLAYTF